MLTKNKKLALILLAVPIVSVLFSLAVVEAMSLLVDYQINLQIANDVSAGITTGQYDQTDLMRAMMFIGFVMYVFGWISSIVLLFCLLPLAIYFLIKNDNELEINKLKSEKEFQDLKNNEIKYLTGWSWSAFVNPLVFALGNGLYWWALGSIIPFWNVYVWLTLALAGKQLAWKEGFIKFEAFKIKQYKLLVVGLIVVSGIVLLIGK
ncbi:hypothetical protein A2533_05045 [Candidatus Falkowbacteria bacterium RIFOXYD2_FULL_35_9]|uniref:Uncharacterized protein n=1 Tax=Candidatus Falkowbacteria bacterium RIFOXYC2_FULL_36_12 TaxID=1798002 RepID=A0A1F5SZW4_9BACT|nr:MAG: hypothetical protein A2478_02875 [Candidatus Falkowbacteria bacterium RIFOXYC2_FULL_36_12]OGF34152.1 MAG: hypothetical protein A2223_01305 [Candidatus Falkowbacteria bacterium RIFOXYA2_FULL_35_8]OGF46425.1 MAG: hypothetical protein A2533_05045 [Candidatus Falkowbacteria bacterium RIFOXYD2_FULL_35_9]